MTIAAGLLRKLEVPAPRYTSYPTVPVWSETFGPDAHARALTALGAAGDEPLSLYVHIPFCRERCSFCGCNVVVSRDRAKAEAYLDVLTRELRLMAGFLGARRRLSRLHLGGGTPTFLDEAQLERLWYAITAELTPEPDAEIALEIDPAVTTRGQLALLGQLGFNRISLGVQDLDPSVQQAIGRIQSFEQTAASVETARANGFRSINLDLIYGLPRQTESSFARTLDQVASLAPDRLAVFSLAYVPEARPNQRRLPIHELPTGAAKLALLEQAQRRLHALGYRAIGFDHFARPHDELARALDEGTLWRDFQGFTTRRAPATVAVGVSGISDLGGAYAQNGRSLAGYARAIAEGRLYTERGLLLTDDDRQRRTIIVDLLCNGRADLGEDAGARFASELEQLAPLAADGLVLTDGRFVRLTTLGRTFARNVAMVFDAYLGGAERPAFSKTI
jgi:oxygen-independent coproporphyrinogen-3 oxidase